MAETEIPERDGYVYLGSVSVDSGALMICDPGYVLRDDEETQKAVRRLGLEDASEKHPTYQEATAVLDGTRFGLLARQNGIALSGRIRRWRVLSIWQIR